MNISLYLFLLFISDVHKKHVMNVWRRLRATNSFPLMTVMASAKTATFVTKIQIILTLFLYVNIA